MSESSLGRVAPMELSTFSDDNIAHAQKLIDSKLLPDAIKTPEQALIIIQKGRELGLGSMESFDSIDVIMGRPSIKPKAKLSLALSTGQVWTKTIKDWEDITDNSGKITDKVTTIRFFRKYGDTVVENDVSFKYSEAAQMGYLSKSNWKSQPNIMSFWRCMSRGLDRVCPDLTRGLYMSDEVADFMGVEYNMTEDGDFKVIESTKGVGELKKG